MGGFLSLFDEESDPKAKPPPPCKTPFELAARMLWFLRKRFAQESFDFFRSEAELSIALCTMSISPPQPIENLRLSSEKIQFLRVGLSQLQGKLDELRILFECFNPWILSVQAQILEDFKQKRRPDCFTNSKKGLERELVNLFSEKRSPSATKRREFIKRLIFESPQAETFPQMNIAILSWFENERPLEELSWFFCAISYNSDAIPSIDLSKASEPADRIKFLLEELKRDRDSKILPSFLATIDKMERQCITPSLGVLETLESSSSLGASRDPQSLDRVNAVNEMASPFKGFEIESPLCLRIRREDFLTKYLKWGISTYDQFALVCPKVSDRATFELQCRAYMRLKDFSFPFLLQPLGVSLDYRDRCRIKFLVFDPSTFQEFVRPHRQPLQTKHVLDFYFQVHEALGSVSLHPFDVSDVLYSSNHGLRFVDPLMVDPNQCGGDSSLNLALGMGRLLRLAENDDLRYLGDLIEGRKHLINLSGEDISTLLRFIRESFEHRLTEPVVKETLALFLRFDAVLYRPHVSELILRTVHTAFRENANVCLEAFKTPFLPKLLSKIVPSMIRNAQEKEVAKNGRVSNQDQSRALGLLFKLLSFLCINDFSESLLDFILTAVKDQHGLGYSPFFFQEALRYAQIMMQFKVRHSQLRKLASALNESPHVTQLGRNEESLCEMIRFFSDEMVTFFVQESVEDATPKYSNIEEEKELRDIVFSGLENENEPVNPNKLLVMELLTLISFLPRDHWAVSLVEQRPEFAQDLLQMVTRDDRAAIRALVEACVLQTTDSTCFLLSGSCIWGFLILHLDDEKEFRDLFVQRLEKTEYRTHFMEGVVMFLQKESLITPQNLSNLFTSLNAIPILSLSFVRGLLPQLLEFYQFSSSTERKDEENLRSLALLLPLLFGPVSSLPDYIGRKAYAQLIIILHRSSYQKYVEKAMNKCPPCEFKSYVSGLLHKKY